jgi:hypothetical protein
MASTADGVQTTAEVESEPQQRRVCSIRQRLDRIDGAVEAKICRGLRRLKMKVNQEVRWQAAARRA